MAFVNAADVYFGAYARFSTTDKNAGAVMAGPDNAIGDVGSFEFRLDENKRSIAWMKNPYGKTVGMLDPSMSYTLEVLQAKGWKLYYILSFVVFSEYPNADLNSYWGEVAVIAFSPRYEKEFGCFLSEFSRRVAEGTRPNPVLTTAEVEGILGAPKSWKPSVFVDLPKFDGNTVLIKDRRSMHDKLLDQGRGKNPGCYLISWLFIFALVGGLAWILHSLGII